MSFNIPGGRYAGTSTEFVKAYIDSKVSNLVASSPESLNTLKELAEAIGSDPAFFTTMATANTNLQNQINAIHTDSDAAELALSNRLNTLEADPTTATAVAAVQADVDANEAAALLARTALQNLLQAAIDAVQADVDQNETDGDAAVLAVQNDVDANETERKTYFKWESNLTKVVNPLRSSEIEIGNNIHIDPAAGYATQFDGNVEFDNNTVLSHGGTDLTATFAEINGFDARIDTLEADPTTAAAVAAVQADVDQNESDADAAIALRAPIAGPTFTGDVTLGAGAFYKESNERLGLGTTSPGGRLHVLDTGNVHAIFQRNGGSSKLAIKNNTTDDGITLQGQVNGPNSIRFEGYGNNIGFRFEENNAGTYTTLAHIKSGSIDLKKNTAITGTLDVSGAVDFASTAEINGQMTMYNDIVFTGSGRNIKFKDNTYNSLRFMNQDGTIYMGFDTQGDPTIFFNQPLDVNTDLDVSGSVVLVLSDYSNDTDAAAGGIPVGGLYRHNNDVKIRLT